MTGDGKPAAVPYMIHPRRERINPKIKLEKEIETMTLKEFSAQLSNLGANDADIVRLNAAGYRAACVAHWEAFQAGELPGVRSYSEYRRYCNSIGRDFVLDNLGDLFQLKET